MWACCKLDRFQTEGPERSDVSVAWWVDRWWGRREPGQLNLWRFAPAIKCGGEFCSLMIEVCMEEQHVITTLSRVQTSAWSVIDQKSYLLTQFRNHKSHNKSNHERRISLQFSVFCGDYLNYSSTRDLGGFCAYLYQHVEESEVFPGRIDRSNRSASVRRFAKPRSHFSVWGENHHWDKYWGVITTHLIYWMSSLQCRVV